MGNLPTCEGNVLVVSRPIILSLLFLQESSSSRFHVLHDWSDGVFDIGVSSPFPAAKVSDIMLKTMGILRVSMH